MCGLFGSLGYPMVNTAAVFTALQERGPDDRGHWKEEMRTDGIELLHTRLAIQDCSPLGHQPMVSGNGRLARSSTRRMDSTNELLIKTKESPNAGI